MAKRAGGCTKQKNGYFRWYKGATRYVCGPNTPADQVEDRWNEKRREIDGEAKDKARRTKLGDMTVRELLSEFLKAMRRRVETRKPRPLSERMLHNYAADGNEFGALIGGDTKIVDVGPEEFRKYAAAIGHLKVSGYDSKVAHVVTMFRWAVANDYLDKTNFGSEFVRPAKQDVRDERVVRTRSFTADEVNAMLKTATGTIKVLTMLGICGGLNNSEVSALEATCVDLDRGMIDFRRRKTGRVRRVIPLPPEVATAMKDYRRPAPADPKHDHLFFLTDDGGRKSNRGRPTLVGVPYCRQSEKGPVNTVSVLFTRLMVEAGVRGEDDEADGRSFAGLRTTLVNLAPPGYRDEVECIIGHSMGSILLDHYVEEEDLSRLKHVVDHVWSAVSSEPKGRSRKTKASAVAPGAEASPPA